MSDVIIENRNALDILERVKGVSDCLIYVDPPYPNARIEGYGPNTVDYDRLEYLLSVQKGRVAVSGHPGDWDWLGWKCHVIDYKFPGMNMSAKERHYDKTECLWVNFE